MKKLLCGLCVLSMLVLGSMVACADPYGPPATNEPEMIQLPVKTILMYKSGL